MASPSAPLIRSSAPFVEALASRATWISVALGGAAGLLGSLVCEPLSAHFDRAEGAVEGLLAGIAQGLASTGLLIAIISLFIGVALLVWENTSSLRGKWHRDVPLGVGLFALGGLVSGGVAQIVYVLAHIALAIGGMRYDGESAPSGVQLLGMMAARGVAWGVFGLGVGACGGLLRRDGKYLQRGLLGGAIGGFLGGLFFDPIAFAFAHQGTGAVSRAVGFAITGACIGGALRLVQETLKSAWLLGISTGPYEGKEFSLSKNRVSIGRGDKCDVSLFRDETLPGQVGELVFQNGLWCWQGEAVPINGAAQTNAALQPGARLQIGQTLFRFNDRSKSAPSAPFPTAPLAPPSNVATPMPVQAPPAPVPVSWTFSPAVGNALTGWRFEGSRQSATIGRAQGNDWLVRDDGTSSRHAKLERTLDGITLTDLGSTNGTFVNGQKIAPNVPVELRGKETIRIGRTQWIVARGS